MRVHICTHTPQARADMHTHTFTGLSALQPQVLVNPSSELQGRKLYTELIRALSPSFSFSLILVSLSLSPSFYLFLLHTHFSLYLSLPLSTSFSFSLILVSLSLSPSFYLFLLHTHFSLSISLSLFLPLSPSHSF
jgi:hypothetical protein